MQELKAVLHQVGEQARSKLKGKHKRLSPRKVADILEKHLNYGLIVADQDEAEKARVSFYDLDGGIYRSNRRLLIQLALEVERNLIIRQQTEVVNYLKIDSPLLAET